MPHRTMMTLSVLVLAGIWAGGCAFTAPPPAPQVLYETAVGLVSDVLSGPVEPVTDPATDQARRQIILARHNLQAKALEIASLFPEIVQPRWFELALASPHDGVKFAALLAVGRLADYEGGRLSRPFVGQVRQLLDERVDMGGGKLAPRNHLIHVTAGYALYRITGDWQVVAFVWEYLNRNKRPVGLGDREFARLRRDVFYVVSLMPAQDPRPVLKDAARSDPDVGVQVMAQTRLAILGDAAGLDATINMIHSPVADDALDALEALEQVRLDDLTPMRVCLRNSQQREVQMAAARLLGLNGDARGLKQALDWLHFKDTDKLPAEVRQNDPEREARVRWCAALALGGIGDYDRSAGPLFDVLRATRDDGQPTSMKVRLAAARASLELLRRSGRWPRPATPPTALPEPRAN